MIQLSSIITWQWLSKLLTKTTGVTTHVFQEIHPSDYVYSAIGYNKGKHIFDIPFYVQATESVLSIVFDPLLSCVNLCSVRWAEDCVRWKQNCEEL